MRSIEVRWVIGWTLALILGLTALISCERWRQGKKSEDPTHCHVFLFSGGALAGNWETDQVRWNINRDAVRFESEGLDYRISGDVVVECGHEVVLS